MTQTAIRLPRCIWCGSKLFKIQTVSLFFIWMRQGNLKN